MKKLPPLTAAQKAQILGDPVSNIALFAPGQAISLWDMLIFTMGELAPWRCLQNEEERIRSRAKESPGAMMGDAEITRFLNGVDSLERFCDKFCLPSSSRQLWSVANHFKGHFSNLTKDGAWRLLDGLIATMRGELNVKKFIYVGEDKMRYLCNKAVFGTEVHAKFKKIDHHAEASGTCFACGQWTASVFHSMLVVESGLRYIAKRLGVKIVRKNLRIEYGSWGEVITACKIEIASHPGRNKRAIAIRIKYAAIIDKCEHLADLWRNPVFHGRRTCKEHEAGKALSDSIAFMEAVSAIKKC
jgi:hypothetical protein